MACHCTRVQGSGHRLAPSSVYVRRAAASRIKLPRVATCLGCAMELVYMNKLRLCHKWVR